jgi:hypothetical protein
MLDIKGHLKYITTEVTQIVRVLAKRRLSPKRKQLVIDQLLKSKYHSTHLGIFTDSQLDTVDKIFNKAAKQALGLMPSFPTEAIHRPTKEMGMGYTSVKDRKKRKQENPYTRACEGHRVRSKSKRPKWE